MILLWSALVSHCDNHKRRSDERTETGAVQNFAGLHLKPGTLEPYGLMLRVELMIVAGACVLQRWGGQ